MFRSGCSGGGYEAIHKNYVGTMRWFKELGAFICLDIVIILSLGLARKRLIREKGFLEQEAYIL